MRFILGELKMICVLHRSLNSEFTRSVTPFYSVFNRGKSKMCGWAQRMISSVDKEGERSTQYPHEPIKHI